MVDKYTEKLKRLEKEKQGVTVVEFREMSIEGIKRLIKEHVEKYGDFWPDEFADDYELSIMDVFGAIDKLTEEGYLESKKKDEVLRRRKS